MGYETVAKTDVESVMPEEFGGMWFLKEPLGTERLGITMLELEPGGNGMEHDEVENDLEEVYLVVEGEIDVDLVDREETVTLGESEAIRLGPDERRQLHNRGEERARLVLTSAPL